MKLIDYLKDLVEGKELPHFKLYGEEYYIGADGCLKRNGDDVEWVIYKDWLNKEIELLEEDEFIDIESLDIHYSWDYIDYKNIEELKKYLNKDFQNIFDTLDKLIKNQKKIINKLKENK